jgi:cell wall-associated NlpC family hydrolase
MYLKRIFIAFFAIGLLSSCGIFKKSTANSTTVKRTARKGSPEFLDNLEIKPGSVVTSRHKTSGLKQEAEKYTAIAAAVKQSIEKANFLQFKYALITDVAVETLNNITLLQKIDNWWGTKYCMGGSTKNCIDCSAFSLTMMRDVYALNLPRTAQEQYNTAEKISTSELKEGDLVFFGSSSRNINHVGIYVTNNKFVHASTSQGVTITDMDERYWSARYRGAGRVNK